VLSTPQNFVVISPAPDALAGKDECQCVGGIFSGFPSGSLSVVLTLTANFTAAAYTISITSIDGTTEVTVPAVQSGNQLFAETLAFNGFIALGGWDIKLLDASGNPSIQNISRGKLEFGLQACN